jgi:hypothetical protein
MLRLGTGVKFFKVGRRGKIICFPSRVLGYMGGGGMLAGIFSLSFLEL